MADLSNQEGEGQCYLWLARAIPLPLSSGENTYSARLAQSLAAAGASVTFMGLADPAAPLLERAKAFENRIEWRIVPGPPRPTGLALASPLPFAAARCATRDYTRHLGAMLRERDFDAVMSWAVAHIRESRRNGARPLIAYIAHNFDTKLALDVARNFRGDLLRKAALYANAWKITRAVRCLASAADIIVTLTAEDGKDLARLSPLSLKLVLPPGYDGPRAPDREIAAATPRRVAIVGSYRWIAKQMNLSAFLEAADPILEEAGVGIDVVGEVPDASRKTWEARVKATRFHGFVDDLGEFLAARRIGLVVEETGGGFKLKALDYIFNRVPIASIRGGMAGLPLTEGRDYLCFGSMRELANGVAATIDDIGALNSMQRGAYRKCERAFDWSDRGRALCDAIRHAVNRKRRVVDDGTNWSTRFPSPSSPA
jgi:polysaccharide biosynthesis protein PslH